jgi:hypothetical protein
MRQLQGIFSSFLVVGKVYNNQFLKEVGVAKFHFKRETGYFSCMELHTRFQP